MSHTPETALRLILDQVDYTRSACSATEMVGAVLPAEVLAIARGVLDPLTTVAATPDVCRAHDALSHAIEGAGTTRAFLILGALRAYERALLAAPRVNQ